MYATVNPTCSAVEQKISHRDRPPEQSEYLMATNRFNSPPASRPFSLKCYFCGFNKHPRHKCPAKDTICGKCQKKGHYARVCRGNPKTSSQVMAATHATSSSAEDHTASVQSRQPESYAEYDLPTSWPPSASLWAICSTSSDGCSPHPLSESMENVKINGHPLKCVADSASSSNFIHPACAEDLKLPLTPIVHNYEVGMASKSLKVNATSYCDVNLKIKDRIYKDLRLYVLPHLCTNLILGLDFLTKHKSVTLNYGGNHPAISICGFSKLKTEPKSIFWNLPPNCTPIADSRRRYSTEDQQFISKEVERMLKEGIVEKSKSPWRAQVVVVKKDGKKRLAMTTVKLLIYTRNWMHIHYH